MAFPISRALARSLKGRFYSVQAARKTERPAAEPLTSLRVNGINVVTTENNAPLSRIVFAIKAGSRYENFANLGITHVIRHITHLTNKEHSSFSIIKGAETLGCGVTATTTRDCAFVSINCTRDVVDHVFELVAPSITRDSFAPFDWSEYQGGVSNVAYDVCALQDNPSIQLMERLHCIAFRDTLANSLYCPESFVGTHTQDQVLNFMKAHYRPERIGIAASGIDNEGLTDLVKTMKFAEATEKPEDKKAVYFGGETRFPRPGLENTYVAVATEGPSLAGKDLLTAALLQQIMGLGPRIKYSDSTVGSKLGTAVKKVTDAPVVINGLNANYTDSGLFGFTVAAPSSDIEKVLRAAFHEFASVTKTGVTDEEVTRGKTHLKADIAMKLESGDALMANLAEQAIGSESFTTVNDIFKMVDAIKTADVVNEAKKLVNGKPSMASVGDLRNVPYLDQLLK